MSLKPNHVGLPKCVCICVLFELFVGLIKLVNHFLVFYVFKKKKKKKKNQKKKRRKIQVLF